MNNKTIIIILIFPVCLTWLERCPFGNAQNESRPFHVICLRRVMFFGRSGVLTKGISIFLLHVRQKNYVATKK